MSDEVKKDENSAFRFLNSLLSDNFETNLGKPEAKSNSDLIFKRYSTVKSMIYLCEMRSKENPKDRFYTIVVYSLIKPPFYLAIQEDLAAAESAYQGIVSELIAEEKRLGFKKKE